MPRAAGKAAAPASGDAAGPRSAARLIERRRVEESASLPQEQLFSAQQTADAGIWDWDMRTGKLNWSRELFRLFGLDPAKVSASFESWGGVLHPDDRQRVLGLIGAALQNHTPLQSEHRIVLPTGEVRWINTPSSSG